MYNSRCFILNIKNVISIPNKNKQKTADLTNKLRAPK